MDIKEREVYYLSLKTKDRIFADEIDKYRLLHHMEESADGKDIKIAAFTLLDDRLDLLIIGPKQKMEQPGKMNDLLREEPVRWGKEKSVKLQEIQKWNMQEEQEVCELRQWVEDTPWILAAKKEGKELLKESSFSYCQIRTPAQALECTSRIHMLSMEEGIVDRLKDYWWSSYQHYRGMQEWTFMDADVILSQFKGSGIDPTERFLRYQQRQIKSTKTGEMAKYFKAGRGKGAVLKEKRKNQKN